MISSSLFSSVSRISLAAKEEQIYSRHEVSPTGGVAGSTPLGTGIKAGILAGVVGAALIYRRLPRETHLAIAKNISSVFKAPRIEETIEGLGVNRGLPSAASEMINLAFSTRGFTKKGVRRIIEEYESLALGNKTEGLASIDDLLKIGNLNRATIAKINIGVNRLAAQSGIASSRIRAIKLGDHIVREGNQITDYRSRTIGGILANALEFSHRNLKVPLTNFAPTDIFLHKAWANQFRTAVVSKGSRIGAYSFGEEAIAIGNKVITKSGNEIAYDNPLKIIQENTSLALSTHAVRGDLRHKSTDKLLTDGDFGFFTKKYMGWQRKLRNLSLPDDLADQVHTLVQSNRYEEADAIINRYAPGFENPLFSPKFAHEHSIAREARVKFQRLVSGRRRFKPKESFVDELEKPEMYSEKDLSVYESTIGSLFRMNSSKYEWVDEYGKVIGSGAMGVVKTHGYQPYAPGAFVSDLIKPATAAGQEGMIATTHTAVTKNELHKSIAHFLVSRPTRLLEQLTGLGMRPSESIGLTLLGGTVGTGALLYGGLELARYTNFLGMGVPSKAVGATLGAAQLGAAGTMNVTGITPAASFLEEYFPGSVNSFASQLVRAVGFPTLGAYLGEKYLENTNLDTAKYKFLRKLGEFTSIKSISGRALGAALGVAAAAASLIVDPTKGVGEVYREVTGEEKVPIRNARGWVAGRQPYGGDSVKYHDYSLSYKLWNQGAGDQTTYGSETQRWMHSWLPTPTNLFGLVPLLDPYHVEEQNQELRPYPRISAAGENLPVIGPLFGATIGQILKPSIRQDIGGYEIGGYAPPGASESLGFQDLSTTLDTSSFSGGGANQQISNLQDYTGLFGFMSQFPLDYVFGNTTGFGGGYTLESSSNITDPGREIEEWNIGGALGNTELIRRLFPGRAGNMTYVNPLPNDAPVWLPGTGSMFEGDQDYKVNFHQGDMFTKVEHGDYRLPGAGYVEMEGLHGGEGYDYFDKYKILSDVAPGSQAHAHFRSLVLNSLGSGELSESDIARVNTIEAQTKERLTGKYSFVDYANTDAVENKFGDGLKRYLGYVNVNIANTPSNPILAPAQTVWDQVTHAQVPGFGQVPFTSWLQGKFMHNRTPYEEYVHGQVIGTDFADWTDPYGAFIEPAGHQMFDFATPGTTFIPAKVEKRREVEEYYDKLKYMKARMLSNQAEEVGNQELAGYYAQQANQTVVGIPYDTLGVNTNLFKALPSSQRTFASSIALATEREQDRFREVLPRHQLPMWENIWSGNANHGARNYANTTERADEEVAAYFSQRQLPGADSAIWNPDVNIEEYKLKTLEAENLGYFEEGIPEAKAREFRQLGRADIILDSSTFTEDLKTRAAIKEALRGNRDVQEYSVASSAIRKNSRVYYNDPERMRTYDSVGQGRF